MKKTKIFAVVLASLACAVLLGSCDYWKEDYYKNGGDSGSQASGGSGSTASAGSGGETSELRYSSPEDSAKCAAFENVFGVGATLYFCIDGKFDDGNPHQGRARVYNNSQGTVLKDGTFQGTFKDQFTFTLDGTTYVGKFMLESGGNSNKHTDWYMDIYDSSGSTLLCTTHSAGWLRIGNSTYGTIWEQPQWQ